MSRKSNLKRKLKKQKEKKKGKSRRSPHFDIHDRNSIENLCVFIRTAAETQEMPPPGFVKQTRENLEGAPQDILDLWDLAMSLVRYLCSEEPLVHRERTSFKRLEPIFRSIGQPEILHILQAAQAMAKGRESLQSLPQFDSMIFESVGDIIQIFQSLENSEPIDEDSFEEWCEACAFKPKLERSLQRFIKLKTPKPDLKASLSFNKDLVDHMPSGLGQKLALAALLRKVIGKKSKVPMADWAKLPGFGQLLDSGKTASISTDHLWSIDKDGNAGQSWNQLARHLKNVDSQMLGFEEYIRFLTLKLRLALYYNSASECEQKGFEDTIYQLLLSLTKGVPPQAKDYAKTSLGHLCDWMLDQVVIDRSLKFGKRATAILYQARPQDFRAAMLHWQESRGDGTMTWSTPSSWQNLDFSAFYQAFAVRPAKPKAFKEYFIDTLSSEGKKEFTLKSCQRAFAPGVPKEVRDHNWQLICEDLMSPDSEPMAGVLQGRPCEPEFLYYVAHAMVDRHRSMDWLDRDQYQTLLRLAGKNAKYMATEYLLKLLAILIPKFPRESLEHLTTIDRLCLYHETSDQVSSSFKAERDFIEACAQLLISSEISPSTTVPHLVSLSKLHKITRGIFHTGRRSSHQRSGESELFKEEF